MILGPDGRPLVVYARRGIGFTAGPCTDDHDTADAIRPTTEFRLPDDHDEVTCQ